MAHQLHPRSHVGFLMGSENRSPDRLAGTPPSHSDTKARSGRSRSYLRELNVGTFQNAQHLAQDTTPPSRHTKAAASFSVDVATPDSLAEDLNNFHIYCPGQDSDDSVGSTKAARQCSIDQERGSPCPPPITSILVSPQTPQLRKANLKPKRTHFALPEQSCGDAEEAGSKLPGSVKHESFSELLSTPGIQHTIEKHDSKNFDWILSLPRDAGHLVKSKHLRRVCSAANLPDIACQDRKVYFGCNLLRQRSLSRSSLTGDDRTINTYTLIATPLDSRIEGSGQELAEQAAPLEQSQTTRGARGATAEAMIDTLLTPGATAPFAAEIVAAEQDRVSSMTLGTSLDTGHADRSQSVPRSPCSSVARIEDTIEELDRLEDQFEAVNRMVRVDRVPSPDKEARSNNPAKAVANSARGPVAKAGTARPRPSDQSRTTSVRRSVMLADPAKKSTEAASESVGAMTATLAGATAKRLSVARPLSLLPPKPPARSSKPPTVSTFELPGEAVARRLKGQREARMLAAIAATKAPAATNAAHRRIRSVKPPTIPTFELPGEAISRRKREEHEAKLRQQEEEERKRREFKARPIRLSITPSTFPRDTVASRARQNRASVVGESAVVGGLSVPGSGPAGNKRLSTVSSESSCRPVDQSQMPRGRGATLGSPSATGQTSRAASTSTGSISGKRSTVSVEDVQHQKLRGKEIFQRDNVLSSDRDRERREREAAAKQARQEAALRSRMLSREWAEKQKRAKKATTAPIEP